MLNRNFEERKLALIVDFYEFTMGEGFFLTDEYKREVVFDVFFRKIPQEGGYAILAGIESVVEFVQHLTFFDDDIEYLRNVGLDESFLEYLKNFKFSGEIYAIREGSVIFPMEPIIRVKAPIIEAVLLEGAILNLFNHQTLIATKASRVVYATKGTGNVMEFGLRRAQGFDAGVLGARAAIIGGCSATSNVSTGKKYGSKISGTQAHLWIQFFPDELTAFRTYAKIHPDNVILLVDTYNVLKSGVPNAIKVFKELREAGELKSYGIRIDSGDIASLSKKASKMLEEEGFHDAIICASNDLNEYLISDLISQGATVNSYGVGTELITSKQCASLGGVYKLAAVEENGELSPRIKLSENEEKITNPGYKTVFRFKDKATKKFIADLIALNGETFDSSEDITLFDPVNTYKKTTLKADTYTVEELLVPLFIDGNCVYEERSLDEIKEYCNLQKESLWEEYKRLYNPHKYHVDLSNKLYDLKKQLIYEHSDNF